MQKHPSEEFALHKRNVSVYAEAREKCAFSLPKKNNLFVYVSSFFSVKFCFSLLFYLSKLRLRYLNVPLRSQKLSFSTVSIHLEFRGSSVRHRCERQYNLTTTNGMVKTENKNSQKDDKF